MKQPRGIIPFLIGVIVTVVVAGGATTLVNRVRPAIIELPTIAPTMMPAPTAGGFSEDADKAAVNLAQPLTDGIQIYIPALDEPINSRMTIVKTPAPAGDSTQPERESSELININRASLDELESLPGIGPTLARRIVDYRDAQGQFTTIEAIMDVSGIGEAKFAQMKDLVTTEGE